ncbi:hypothetical protein J2S43_007816 [Catenuloplanes nepalensis]|uniref:Lipoprotein n=1 Tax=Catenuloplanes nepalensis TaxID=587533 RepID=A0ABT9N6I3_9ACTN|nr:hypothetical protein [Catenuloplanes nepalensis]MDP9799304.1 hypothetical protein [Catenuloplanes nepalensis]
MTRLAALAAVAVLALTGCAAQDTGDGGRLAEVIDRLGHASAETYTAVYALGTGEMATVVSSPPRTATISGDDRLVIGPDGVTLCKDGACSRPPGAADAPGGTGIVTPEQVRAMVSAAAHLPGVDVALSTATFAGREALCADVHGLSDFTVCVTEDGILASFRGDGEITLELTRLAESADASLAGF